LIEIFNHFAAVDESRLPRQQGKVSSNATDKNILSRGSGVGVAHNDVSYANGQQPSGAVLRSSREPGELSQ